MIGADGYPVLTDFGLATKAKRSQSLCGTAEYMAPEVCQTPRDYGPECDWWSFGCLLYELLTGEPPFYANTRPETFYKIRNSNLQFQHHVP